MKKYQPYFLILFFIILLSVPVYWLLKGEAAPEISTVEARTLVALQPKSTPNLQRALNLIEQGNIREGVEILINLFTASSFIEKIEQATSDQFPLRMPIIRFSKATERVIIKLAYSFVDDPIIPADMTNDIYVDTINNQLIFSPTLFNEKAVELIDHRINNYKQLIQTYPDIQFYLYYHQLIQDSEYHPANQYFSEADQSQAIRYFESNLPEGLAMKKFMLTGMSDHLKYYYRTDHHWNVLGIIRSYEEIYQLLSQGYPDISPMLEIQNIVEFPEISFLGNRARLTFYPIDGDNFSVEVVDFPPHEMIYSGQDIKTNPRLAYFEGNYSMIPYTNHFNEFYGNVTDFIEYTFENNSDRNLLIIGSSFRYALDPLLATHYRKTYCIDLRYYSDFSLSEFLSDHNVDDILLVGSNQVVFQDLEYWEIKP